MQKKKTILKIAILGLSLAISTIFSFIEAYYFIKFPGTGTLELHLIPLFVINYLFNEYYGILLATILLTFNFFFIPSNIVSAWSFLLDYVLPTYGVVIWFFFYNLFFKIKLQTISLKSFFNYFWLILVIFLFKWGCNTASGHLFFQVSWLKSLLLNSTYNAVTFIFFLLIYKKVRIIVNNYHEKYY
ncbi:energy-coupled thiamine transporter ThiT [symbiont of Argiope bruennichi]|uniref:energy-coupled thiamine transporter ThiT n=1 Tax=symbiont of Argiope bruennichi TaxID=2810479 RepID=UPI003DA5A3CE